MIKYPRGTTAPATALATATTTKAASQPTAIAFPHCRRGDRDKL